MDNNETTQLLRESAERFVLSEIPIGRVRRLFEAEPAFEKSMWLKMADLGWMRILIPERYQGIGLGLPDMAAVLEPLAGHLAPEPLNAATLACRCIVHGDNEPLKQRLLPAIGAGQTIAALAWQENEAHLDPRECAVTAQSTSTGWTLTGNKRFVVPAELADGYVVAATVEGRIALYWVPAEASGLNVTLEALADGRKSATICLNNVQVLADACIAGPNAGLAALARALDEATILGALESMGVMSRALDITLDYLRTRVQFGSPIGAFQALQHRAVNMQIQRALCRASLQSCLAIVDRRTSADSAAAAASRAKIRCGEAGLSVLRECIQMHGAIGFTHDCDIGLYLKRTLMLASWLGNPAAHRRRYSALTAAAGAAPAVETAATAEMPGDTDWNSLPDEEFRKQVRLFFQRYYPANLRYLNRHPHWNEFKDWFGVLHKKGWMAPSWPREYGGMGLTPSKLLIFVEERENWGVARGPDHGVNLIGPLLIKFGTPAQKARYLPAMLTGGERWCQGYSEPNSGSDLASLRTSAVLDGDEFVITGQKIWTSYGAGATHMFMLARTSSGTRKQDGISFLILDLKTPGVTIRPIKNLVGHEHFCEVFFDAARTSINNLVGEINKGWYVAKALLGFERLFSGSPKRPQQALNRLITLARKQQLFSDPVFADRLTRLRLDVEDHAALYEVFADIVRRGEPLGADVSMLKVWGSETYQRLSELMVEAAGNAGGASGDLPFGGEAIDVLGQYYDSFPATIASGTNEIQRNIIAKYVLNLPVR